MAGSSYGNLFRITTFGESHGKAVGVVIDGCPAGLHLTTPRALPWDSPHVEILNKLPYDDPAI